MAYVKTGIKLLDTFEKTKEKRNQSKGKVGFGYDDLNILLAISVTSWLPNFVANCTLLF